MIEALYVLAIIVSLSTRTTAYYRASNCSNITFAPNSTYETNLNHLLSSLSSNHTSFDGSLFYNTTVGQSPGTDIVYGSFLCRGDLPPKECQACVARAASEVTDKCPNRKEAVVWYDECMLQYANESLFGRMREDPGYYFWNQENVSIADQGAFDRLVGHTMMEAVDAALSANNRFATREANFSAFHNLYSTVQCTPDISSADCSFCLSDAVSSIPKCCAGRRGGRVLFPICNVRYESYRFYGLVNPPAAPNPAPVILPSAPPESAIGSGGSNDHSIWPTVIAVCVPIGVLSLAFLIGCYWLKRRPVLSNYNAVQLWDQNAGSGIVTTVESLQYDLGRIQAATNNFSYENKLGEGGFGAVYKGVLSNGQEIAVKRLSRTSLQGVSEFKNEILLVAKLQHRNLTRLLGFCLEEEEKILVYEFVPNKSLDYILFDRSSDSVPLDWSMRYKIIGWIARGVLYLHEDSRLKIIHRDLKASNVLLDEQMIPKISDFGMAKLCGVDESHGNTSRIVGTYGYMSPEYAFYGQFSVKSDVYSFGVLIIEIVTGKKCTRFLNSENSAENLLIFTWKHWTNRTPLELVDPRLGDSYTPNEVTRCIHIGLLCVQEDPDDRPTMATVVLMLSSFSVSLPLPKQPAFFPHSRTAGVMPLIESGSERSTSKSLTVNEMSITETFPR